MSGSSYAIASEIYPEQKPNLVPACKIRVNDYIVIHGRPCQVYSVSPFGTNTLSFLCWNIFNGNETVGIFRLETLCEVPHVSQDKYEVIGISEDDDSVTLLSDSGDTRDDVKLPTHSHDKFLDILRFLVKDGIKRGSKVVVTVVSSIGQAHIVGVHSSKKEAQPQNDTTLTNVHKGKSKMDQVEEKPSADPRSFKISTQRCSSMGKTGVHNKDCVTRRTGTEKAYHIKLSNQFDSLTTT